jgi:hypothetical protein
MNLMRRAWLVSVLAVAVWCLPVHAIEQKLLPSDAAPEDFFGTSVSISE